MNAVPIYDSSISCGVPQKISRPVRFAIVGTGTCPPCGLARFTAGLASALGKSAVSWVADTPDGSMAAGRSQVDVAIVQHEVGTTDDVVEIVDGLGVPSIVVVHSIPEQPTAQQCSSLEAIAAIADRVVVMSEAARQRLYLTYAMDRRKIATIPHGATLPTVPRVKRPSRPTILTWGLLRPGKGIERVIDVMPTLGDIPGRPRYLVAGPMDPAIPVAEAEAYRDARVEQARRLGVADSVSFDPRYYDNSSLAALIQQASVVVVPNDSTAQVSSGVLVDALANGRPIVATAFSHAIELLASGAGMVVEHDDPVALAGALRQIITQPRLAGSMAAEVRRRAPEVGWPVVAAAYTELAQRVMAEPRADRFGRGAETTESRD
ncbi:glycosyl transferase family 1 [Mycolicibacterium moriokaense]|nr:glycosyl transferase family 1 [Mycolicibacterium moriokaense]